MGAQAGLARHESPYRGRRLLTLARALVDDHPQILGMLEAGDINEHRAELITLETQDLGRDDRLVVDRAMADFLAAYPCPGDRAVADQTRRVVMRIDEAGAMRRPEKAHSRRHVTSRTFGDGTAQVNGTIADYQMVAIMGSLDERVALMRSMGDERSSAQIRADLFVERLTGQVIATSVPLAIHLVVSAESLLGDATEPAEVPGLGPIPAALARKLALASPEQGATIRRLFADTDHLVAMESTSRTFDGLLRAFITIRDRRCRTPWCDAPIRHLDHPRPAAAGGRTSLHNSQGLCESCNYVKEEPGWTAEVVSTAVIEPHIIEVTDPIGHHHSSREPPPSVDPHHGYVHRHPGVWTRAA